MSSHKRGCGMAPWVTARRMRLRITVRGIPTNEGDNGSTGLHKHMRPEDPGQINPGRHGMDALSRHTGRRTPQWLGNGQGNSAIPTIRMETQAVVREARVKPKPPASRKPIFANA